MTEYLIMRCAGEFDSVIVVAESDSGFLADISSRFESIKKLTGEDPNQDGISSVSYWDDVDVFERFDEERLDDKLYADFEERKWILVDSIPVGMNPDPTIRVEACELNIYMSGEFFSWTFTPKYGSVQYETPVIRFSDLKGSKNE